MGEIRKFYTKVVSNRKQMVFFDRDFHVSSHICAPIDITERKYVLRIEGIVVGESDDKVKIKTSNFWGSYGNSIIKYPTAEIANKYINPLIGKFYWVDKDKVTSYEHK